MALTSTIHKRLGIRVSIVAIVLILLLVGGDIVRYNAMWSSRQHAVTGRIAGQDISFATYQAYVEELRSAFPQPTDQQEAIIRTQAWHRLITEIVYQQECDALGIATSAPELVDRVQGEHVHPELRAAFQDPTTKQFDKQRLIAYLRSLPQMSAEQRAYWDRAERAIADARAQEKLNLLMTKSVFVTSAEAQAYAVEPATRHVKCVYIPYYTYPDHKVQITEAMLKYYLDMHKSAYQVEESRSVQYITFPMLPTPIDEQELQEELQTLKAYFEQTQEDVTFAKYNTDGHSASTHVRLSKAELPPALATGNTRLKKGMVIGPVREGDVYKLYKVVATRSRTTPKYELAVIEKQLVPGDQARDQLFKKADYCASSVKSKLQLAAYAVQEQLQLHKARVGKDDVQVGDLDQARVLVRWLYSEAKVGQISPVLTLGDRYVVAVMTQKVAPGCAPLAQVRDSIRSKVSNVQKARAIMAKLRACAGTTLEEKVTSYGPGAVLVEVKELRFDEDTLQNGGIARKAVGTAFALPVGASAMVADEHGVFIVEVVADNKVAALQEGACSIWRESLRKLNQRDQVANMFQAFKLLVPIQDERYRFY
jgi:peptidyl-prolyl cis-trans isomerase D